jgi:hypothetical protein
MSRLELSDTGMDVIVKMADGNPGAITAMMDILEKHDEIDPQAILGGMGAIMILDTWEIYGTDIYVLWSDKCNRDVRQMLMLMRATQLGIFSHINLKEMAADQMRQVNLSDEEMAGLDEKVCEQLKDFARPK